MIVNNFSYARSSRRFVILTLLLSFVYPIFSLSSPTLLPKANAVLTSTATAISGSEYWTNTNFNNKQITTTEITDPVKPWTAITSKLSSLDDGYTELAFKSQACTSITTYCTPLSTNFSFSFAGTTYSHVYIGTNGYILFDHTASYHSYPYTISSIPYSGIGMCVGDRYVDALYYRIDSNGDLHIRSEYHDFSDAFSTSPQIYEVTLINGGNSIKVAIGTFTQSSARPCTSPGGSGIFYTTTPGSGSSTTLKNFPSGSTSPANSQTLFTTSNGPAVSASSNPLNVTRNLTFYDTITTSGGSGITTLSMDSPKPGVSFDATTGVLTVNETQSVGTSFTQTFTATDSSGATGTLTVTINVVAATQATLNETATVLTGSYNGTNYSAQPGFSVTGGSGTGAVTYAIVAGGTATSCAMVGSTETATVTATTTGTCLVRATKAADDTYSSQNSANNVTITFSTGNQSALTIYETNTVAVYNGSTYSYAPLFYTSGGSSGGAVTYSIKSGGTATSCALGTSAYNATLTATTTGTCFIQATMAGNTNYNAVTSSNYVTFTFNLAPQATLVITESVTTAAYNGSTYTAIPNFGTTGGSGSGAVTYSIASGGTASDCALSSSASGATLTATSTGTCLIQATKAASTGYLVANSSTITFTFTKPLAITTPTNGLVATKDIAFSLNIAPLVVGGTGPYTYTGTLPSWLTINSSGLLSGTPTVAGRTAAITITVTDSKSVSVTTGSFYISITPCGVSTSLSYTLLSPNGYCVVQLSTAGTGTWTPPTGVSNSQVVLIGGGGGAGKSASSTSSPVGGGGGGGGVSATTLVDVSSGSAVSVTVGAGGSGATSAADDAASRNGGSTTFGSLPTIYGGGGGGSAIAGTGYAGAGGSNLASGGGGGGLSTAGNCTTQGASGGSVSGHNGSYGVWGWGGAGGGAGGSATNGDCTANYGQPGSGVSNSITGSSVTYGRGGFANYANASAVTAQFGWGGSTAYNGGNANGNGYSGQSGAIFIQYIGPAVVVTNLDSTGDTATVNSGSGLTLIETTTTVTSFTRSVIWQYSTDSGATWNTENASAISGGNNQATYKFNVRCGMHNSNTCNSSSIQIWYRAQITDTDSTLITYSYSPVITVTINALPTTKLIISSTVSGSTFVLSTSGGGGTGAKSFAIVIGGTASGCSIPLNTLSATGSGTCLVQPNQAADSDYLASTGAVVTFFINMVLTTSVNQWVAPVGNHGIGGMVSSPGVQNNSAATGASTLSITGLSANSGAAGSTITITGTGFMDGSGISRISGISFNLDNVSYTVNSSTSITVTIPSSETSGTSDNFTILPVSGATIFSNDTFSVP